MKIAVKASREYDVTIDTNILANVGDMVAKLKKPGKVLIVTDDVVDSLYSDVVLNSLKNSGFNVFKYVIKHGEQSKTLSTYVDILNYLGDSDFVRSDIVLALGGGVVGDLAGFVASSYMRGIDYVQVPTTLLAMIDSSVGGKTAVDLPAGKNLVGAFYQPIAVIADTSTLLTLPCIEYQNGIGEGIKYAVLDGGELLDIVKDGIKCSCTSNINRFVELCVDSKRRIVEADEKEGGVRKLLNLGHTFAHTIEKLSNYTIPHGICVASGLYKIARVSLNQGKLSKNDYDEIVAMLLAYDLKDITIYSDKQMISVMNVDKKVSDNALSFVMPYAIGDCRIEKIDLSKIEDYLECK